MMTEASLNWTPLEVNGGVVEPDGENGLRLRLPVVAAGYADAQIDDCNHHRRAAFPWRPGLSLRLRARFSHPAGRLKGTAGFGFWNAPFSDPRQSWPALPQAAWFFYGSAPNDLPLAPVGPGRGWFVATLDATRPRALAMAPLAPLVLLLNQLAPLRRRLWPLVQRGLRISYRPLETDLTAWHDYRLQWGRDGCQFAVDGATVLQTSHYPKGPLGFVCWIDNQYMVATPTGRLRWGTLVLDEPQWLEVADLELDQLLK